MEFLETMNTVLMAAFLLCYAYQFFYILIPHLRRDKPHKPPRMNRYAILICARNEEKRLRYTHARPFTKESLLYREIFEKYYPGQSEMIVDFWMPNRAWQGCDVNDPSARVLSNYGASGK